MIVALWSASACTPAGDQDDASTTSESTSTENGAVATGTGTSTQASQSGSGEGSKDDEFTTGQLPVVVTSTNLTEVEILCTTTRDDKEDQSTIRCEAALPGPNGAAPSLQATLVPATDIQAGLTVNWSLRRLFGDAFNGQSLCQEGVKGLSYECAFPDDANIAVAVAVNMTIVNAQSTPLTSLDKRVAFRNECDDLPTATTYDAFGKGTLDSPFLFCYSAQFVDFANQRCNADAGLGCASHIRVGRDIDGTGVTKAIGSAAHPYVGHFFGNGYKIRNITLDPAGDLPLGVFGAIGDGAILDFFTIDETTINAPFAGGLLVYEAGAGSLITDVSVRNSSLTIGTNSAVAGGIVGLLKGTLARSAFDATLQALGGSVGGLAGQVQGGTISESWARLSFSGLGSLGGMAGILSSGSISDSFVLGSIQGSYVGGIAGVAGGGAIVLNNVYSAATISANGQSYFIGGIVGNDGSGGGNIAATNTYYLASPSYLAAGSYSAQTQHALPGVTPLTDAQLRDKASFVGWDFDTVWQIDAAPASYPYLRRTYPELVAPL